MKFQMNTMLIDLSSFGPDSFCLDDIAHHLAKINRYNGALPIDVTYSVAEHSMDLARFFGYPFLKTNNVVVALLHDASEAILGDLPPHVKEFCPEYKKVEKRVQSIIYKKYLDIENPPEQKIVSIYDKRILIDEVIAIIPEKVEIYKRENKKVELGALISYNNKPSKVKAAFLKMCADLNIKEPE